MDTLEQPGVRTPGPSGDRGPRHRVPRRRHPVRRAILVAVVVLLAPVAWSYGRALTAPGSSPLSARTVEWIKAHHGGSLVIAFERLWYTWHQPAVGGTPSGGIPVAAAGDVASPSASPTQRAQHPTGPAHLAAPADVRPIPTPRGARQSAARSSYGDRGSASRATGRWSTSTGPASRRPRSRSCCGTPGAFARWSSTSTWTGRTGTTTRTRRPPLASPRTRC
jgi:hypothetical protein